MIIARKMYVSEKKAYRMQKTIVAIEEVTPAQAKVRVVELTAQKSIMMTGPMWSTK